MREQDPFSRIDVYMSVQDFFILEIRALSM